MATTEGNPFLTMHRFRPLTLLAALSGAAALGVALPSLVQAQVPAAQVRALNLARNTAVTQNGGLGVYRPQPCMFETSAGGGSCLISNNADGFTFLFLGGKPGWPENNSPATTETEILVAPDGTAVEQVIYNGAPR
ncbi:hypothetical protein [Synechococcus sp. RS9916]|uniref:hypothetical protein n=1 Tax=Synechococcus sp. RS9916 TaxID=221359 RepID=UPI0000E536C0|nr:hypothetical protein RS9916_34937 [Synechococcus sp. RS9916]